MMTEKTAEKNSIKKPGESLLKFLRSRKEDRGLMANLRCALVESKRHRAWPYLKDFDCIDDEKYRSRVIQTIAGLYATHSEETHEGNFGAMCHKLLSDDERQKLNQAEGIGPVSRRFQHLLASEGEEIFDRVRHLVLRAKAQDNIRVNYEQLYKDLLDWEERTDRNRRDRVRVRWAQSFWTPEVELDVEETP
jgi:CRISPR system Cascade subunit CasB